MTRTIRLLLLTALCILAATGCSDDDSPVDPGPADPPVHETEDALMAAFKTAYEDLDLDAYTDEILDDAYTCIFPEGSPYARPAGWNRSAELISATNMFTGEAGWDEVMGLARPGVQDISIPVLIRREDWTDVPPSDPDFPGARKALYDVELVLYLDTGANTVTVMGQQLFYVMGEDVQVDGETVTAWRLCGQKDLTSDLKGNEDQSWSTVKACFGERYPSAVNEDQLMANFSAAYQAMDREVYVDDVLHDEYHFVFHEGSPYAPPGGWDRAAEVESATAMFAGETGWDEVVGVAKPGVLHIHFRELERRDEWVDVPLNDPVFPGARKAIYDVDLVFYLDTFSSTINVEGQQVFYVMSEQVEVEGVQETRWRLMGQQDLTEEGKSNDNMSWGSVKALY